MGEKYVVKEGDSLSKIGQERWKKIYKVNKGKIGEDPNVIKPGQEFTLPNGIAPQPVDEYVDPSSYAPDSCMSCTCDSLASSTYETWDVYYSELPVTPLPKSSAQKGAASYFAETPTETLFELADERSYSPIYDKWDYNSRAASAVESLKARAESGRLTPEEFEEAAEHDNPEVRLIAALDEKASNEVLFELADEKGLEEKPRRWTYNKIARSALNTLQSRAEAGRLTADELEEAAEHDNPDVRMIAAVNAKTSNEVLFELAEEKSYSQIWERWEYNSRAKAAAKALAARAEAGRFSLDELEEAAEHDNPDVRMIAAVNAKTPIEILFELAENYKSKIYGQCATFALMKLNDRAKTGKLTTEDMEDAADHRNPDVRMIAAKSR
jgi:hypothetical protein